MSTTANQIENTKSFTLPNRGIFTFKRLTIGEDIQAGIETAKLLQDSINRVDPVTAYRASALATLKTAAVTMPDGFKFDNAFTTEIEDLYNAYVKWIDFFRTDLANLSKSPGEV